MQMGSPLDTFVRWSRALPFGSAHWKHFLHQPKSAPLCCCVLLLPPPVHSVFTPPLPLLLGSPLQLHLLPLLPFSPCCPQGSQPFQSNHQPKIIYLPLLQAASNEDFQMTWNEHSMLAFSPAQSCVLPQADLPGFPMSARTLFASSHCHSSTIFTGRVPGCLPKAPSHQSQKCSPWFIVVCQPVCPPSHFHLQIVGAPAKQNQPTVQSQLVHTIMCIIKVLAG